MAVWYAWGDGLSVAGPTVRHRQLAVGYRTGVRMTQMGDGAPEVAGFGEWRRSAPVPVVGGGTWMVELSSAFGAVWDEGAPGAAMMPAGAPVVVVVRFQDRVRPGVWRVFQFHDAVLLPGDVADDAQRMMRGVRFAAGWCEEFKSGVMPGLEPRVRGVLEWRHGGRAVRAWEYDPEADVWAEDPENALVVEGETLHYVGMSESGGVVTLSMLAAMTGDGVMGGDAAAVLGWVDVDVFSVSAAGGLVFSPGWLLEADGSPEPLLLPESGRHWEHPRVVVRVLGRVYATFCAGVVAVPDLRMEDPGAMLDVPVRLGDMRMFPDGAWIF